MSEPITRRSLLRVAASAGTALGAADLAGLISLTPATAAEMRVTPELVWLDADLQPIVRLIEDTPRERCVEMMLQQLRGGLPYRHFLAALYLVAIRAAPYHGAVHPFDHNAYSIHSIHQLTLDLPASERLLPTFWALDSLKANLSAYHGPRPPALTGSLPAGDSAARELQAGIEAWDRERAERGMVALVRTQGASRVIECLMPYVGRDWFFIGHLAILVSNSWRLLETIG